jgi:hypothetical protein
MLAVETTRVATKHAAKDGVFMFDSRVEDTKSELQQVLYFVSLSLPTVRFETLRDPR